MPDIVVMFFLLGMFAGLVRSDLSLPKAAYDLISLLLMLTIGLKGGMALYGNLDWKLLPELLAVIAPTARVSRRTTARSAPVLSPSPSPTWRAGKSLMPPR